MKVAILDDYAGLALASADWSRVSSRSEITVFRVHLSEDEAAEALEEFDVICTLRERMAMPESLLNRLPKLKLITLVGAASTVDVAAAKSLGVIVKRCDYADAESEAGPSATPEFAWGLLVATVRGLAHEAQRVRDGGWQGSAGMRLAGRTLGILGLGRIGIKMARYAQVFDMKVIAWSEHLTPEMAASVGVIRVTKEELFREADIVSVHLKLSPRTRGLVSARELALMKPTSFLINTARGPIVVEADLIAALRSNAIAGAGLDVFDREPLPLDHPFRSLANVTATPHLGYATPERLAATYLATANEVAAYLDDALLVCGV